MGPPQWAMGVALRSAKSAGWELLTNWWPKPEEGGESRRWRKQEGLLFLHTFTHYEVSKELCL